MLNLNPFTQFPYPDTPEADDHIRRYEGRFDHFYINPNHKNSNLKYYALYKKKEDKPVVLQSKEEMFSEMEDAVEEAGKSGGYNFTLGMYHEDQFKVWRRYDQPCQGGEMRKYGVSHDDCTRPKDPRPTDLSTPFPDGTPLAVATQSGYITDSLLEHMVHPNSIYRRAYGFEDNIQVVRKHGSPIGVIIKDVSVAEPTMIVTFFKSLRGATNFGPYKILFDKGYTIAEVQALIQLRIFGSSSWGGGSQVADYPGNPGYVNLKIFKGGIEASSDLTGGTLGQRYDYHRPNLLEVFKGPIGTNISKNEIIKTCFDGKTVLKSVADSLDRFRDGIYSLSEQKVAA